MAIARPQPAAANAIARPWRRTRGIQPLVAETANAPADGAANISPVDHGACICAARNGSSILFTGGSASRKVNDKVIPNEGVLRP